MRRLVIGLAILASLTASTLSTLQSVSQPARASSTTDCAQPPSNVDHASLTDAQLDYYGLRRRQPGEALALWQVDVRSANIHVCKSEAPKTLLNYPHHLKNAHKSSTSNSVFYNDNWAGYLASGGGYTNVYGQFNVPCYGSSIPSSVASMWVGLDGAGTFGGDNHLPQTGITVDPFHTWNGSHYYAWIQDVPDDSYAVNAFTVGCGDTMVANVYQDYSGGNPVKVHMYIHDLNSGKYWNAYNTASFTNGSTAEWVVERPTSNNSIVPLANFQWDYFKSCYTTQFGQLKGYNQMPLTTLLLSGSPSVIVGGTTNDYPADIGFSFRVDYNPYNT